MRARVEVSRGSFIKRELHQGEHIDFVSPLPSPFNYGFIPDRPGDDGDPLDAVIMGPRLPSGSDVTLPAVAWVRFVDAGARDDKLVLSARPLTATQRRALVAFFVFYARAKGLLGALRGHSGPTRFEGLDDYRAV